MRRQSIIFLAFVGILWSFPTAVSAGMPVPYGLNDIARMRFEAISFFRIVILSSAAVVRWLWNGLRSSFVRLPHLSYGKALSLVVLWSLLFSIVLLMISGARELITPGAWEKHGATYRLKEGPTQ